MSHDPRRARHGLGDGVALVTARRSSHGVNENLTRHAVSRDHWRVERQEGGGVTSAGGFDPIADNPLAGTQGVAAMPAAP